MELHEALSNAPWNILDTFDTVDDIAETFIQLYLDICKQYIPTKNVLIRPKDKHRMTSEVRRNFRIRDRLHKKWKRHKT